MSTTEFDELKLRQIIRADFVAKDDYRFGFQRAVQAVMRERACQVLRRGRL